MSLGGCSTFGKYGGKETSGRTLQEKYKGIKEQSTG